MAKLILVIFTVLCLTQSFGQNGPTGTFIGLFPIKDYGNPAKPDHKWYHLSELTFIGDSIFLEQSPVIIHKSDTIFSASDGGFYSYRGTVKKHKGKTIASLTLINCDYCPMQILYFSPPKIVDDYDTSTVSLPDTLINADESKKIENPKLINKTLRIVKSKNVNIIWVNRNIFRRQEK